MALKYVFCFALLNDYELCLQHFIFSYSVDNGAKLAIRIAWNNKLLRRVQSDKEYIQPMNSYVSIHNKFEFKSASTFPAQFELLDIKFTNIAALRDAGELPFFTFYAQYK